MAQMELNLSAMYKPAVSLSCTFSLWSAVADCKYIHPNSHERSWCILCQCKWTISPITKCGKFPWN